MENGRPHPYVGVVIVRGNEILGSACRGDGVPGGHAEFIALENKLPKEVLAGCTVYTTLEPCTTRNHPKVPCSDRLIQRRVHRVVIGMLDPDQHITGKGLLRLRRAGIAVDLFPPELMSELEELNRDFIRHHDVALATAATAGITEAGITAFYPSRDFYVRLRPDAATIDRYVSTAEHTVIMVSVNLMTGLPFNDLCACLERMLVASPRKFRVTISLLDPRRPELMAVMSPILNSKASDLARNIHRTLNDLIVFRAKLPKNSLKRFDVRVHPALPFGSAILLDHEYPNGRIQIETKPYKVGLQRSFAFEVGRAGQDGLFDVLVKSYIQLLRDGQSWSAMDIHDSVLSGANQLKGRRHV